MAGRVPFNGTLKVFWRSKPTHPRNAAGRNQIKIFGDSWLEQICYNPLSQVRLEMHPTSKICLTTLSESRALAPII
jgi:hypothetical protein